MKNEHKVLAFFGLLLVAIGGLAIVTYWRTTLLTPAEPLPIVQAPTSTPSEPSRPETKIVKSADGVTTVQLTNVVDERLVIENPTYVMGTTTAFESRIAWKMTDAAGRIISEGGTQVASPDAGVPGPFRIPLFYDAAPAVDVGTLHIFESSAKDGQPIHDVKIPVSFKYTSGKGNGCEARVKVAFSNTKEDPNMLDCSKTSLVERIACGTPTPALGIHELLKGPTGGEKDRGFVTSLPPGVSDPEVLSDRVDFDSFLEAGVAGSCRVTAIRAQIIDTLKANGMTGEPVISIDGRVDDILQP